MTFVPTALKLYETPFASTVTVFFSELTEEIVPLSVSALLDHVPALSELFAALAVFSPTALAG